MDTEEMSADVGLHGRPRQVLASCLQVCLDSGAKMVKHNKFGEGVITEQDSSYVSVKFVTENKIKKFVYPTCFKSFLQLMDAETATKIDETVKEHEIDHLAGIII